MTDSPSTPWRLTGAYRYVRGWFGGLVLEVEESRDIRGDVADERFPQLNAERRVQTRWRRARYSDMWPLRDLNPTKFLPPQAT